MKRLRKGILPKMIQQWPDDLVTRLTIGMIDWWSAWPPWTLDHGCVMAHELIGRWRLALDPSSPTPSRGLACYTTCLLGIQIPGIQVRPVYQEQETEDISGAMLFTYLWDPTGHMCWSESL